MEITLFSKPNCNRCKATARHMDRLGLSYTYRDVTEDDSAADHVRLLGYSSLPVVTVGDMHWDGYRPDQVEKLAVTHKKAVDVAPLDESAIDYLTEEET